MGNIRTQVAVIGAGPAGLTLANLLSRGGIDCVLLEEQTREFIEHRPRAGFIEEWAVRALERNGLADRLLRTAQTHSAFEFRFEGTRHRFEYGELTGHRHFVYPQPQLVTDLVAAYPGDAWFSVQDVRLHDLESAPTVSFAHNGEEHRISCDFVAGCDGARGVCQDYVPGERATHDYGIGWLALLAKAPPSADGVIFGASPGTWRVRRRSHASTCSAHLTTPTPTGRRACLGRAADSFDSAGRRDHRG